MAVELERNESSTQPVTQNELREASKGIREDFIVIFGLFASLLIFIGVEIQVFQKAPRFSMMVGFSVFLLGAMLAFLWGIYNIVKDRRDFVQDYIKNPIFYFIVACFVGAVACFWWAAFHDSRQPSQKTIQAQNDKIEALTKELRTFKNEQKTLQKTN